MAGRVDGFQVQDLRGAMRAAVGVRSGLVAWRSSTVAERLVGSGTLHEQEQPYQVQCPR